MVERKDRGAVGSRMVRVPKPENAVAIGKELAKLFRTRDFGTAEQAPSPRTKPQEAKK